MPTLFEVCVWVTPFPPEGLEILSTGSPNVYFTTECSQDSIAQIHLDITVTQADSLITANLSNPSFYILDVRTPDEYSNGHLQDAMNFNYYAPGFGSCLDTLNKNDIYLVYCRTSGRSSRSIDTMKVLRFIETYNMLGGIEAWISAGYQTVSHIEEFEELSRSVKIYPNPTHTILKLETEKSNLYSIEINSLNGRLIYTDKMEGTTHQLDLSSFRAGVYFITIRSKDFVTTRKIIKL
jgi:rhodanese-related sulfurtransferase